MISYFIPEQQKNSLIEQLETVSMQARNDAVCVRVGTVISDCGFTPTRRCATILSSPTFRT